MRSGTILNRSRRRRPLRRTGAIPLVHVPFDDVRKCAFRVLVYHERIAVEFFHAVTDGTGGMIFLKTLVAEYLCQRYGISIPGGARRAGPAGGPERGGDGGQLFALCGQRPRERKESTAYQLSGTLEPDGFLNLTTLMVPVDAVRKCAKEHHVSVTELLAAAMMKAICELQAEQTPRRRHRKPVKVCCRSICGRWFPSRTLRNFASYGHAGDRSAARRLHVRRDLPRGSLPDGAGERPAG